MAVTSSLFTSALVLAGYAGSADSDFPSEASPVER